MTRAAPISVLLASLSAVTPQVASAYHESAVRRSSSGSTNFNPPYEIAVSLSE